MTKQEFISHCVAALASEDLYVVEAAARGIEFLEDYASREVGDALAAFACPKADWLENVVRSIGHGILLRHRHR